MDEYKARAKHVEEEIQRDKDEVQRDNDEVNDSRRKLYH
jgi:hypothetical protein